MQFGLHVENTVAADLETVKHVHVVNTVAANLKDVFFACTLYWEFHNLGEFAKITGTNMLFLVHYLVQQT